MAGVSHPHKSMMSDSERPARRNARAALRRRSCTIRCTVIFFVTGSLVASPARRQAFAQARRKLRIGLPPRSLRICLALHPSPVKGAEHRCRRLPAKVGRDYYGILAGVAALAAHEAQERLRVWLPQGALLKQRANRPRQAIAATLWTLKHRAVADVVAAVGGCTTYRTWYLVGHWGYLLNPSHVVAVASGRLPGSFKRMLGSKWRQRIGS